MVFSVGSQVIVTQDNGKQELIKVSPKKKFGKFPVGKVIGAENLTHWELQNVSGKPDWVVVEGERKAYLDADSEAAQSGLDNRELPQDNTAQDLTQTDVEELKKRKFGEEMVLELASHSETFSSKTRFSQEKYLKRKRIKYAPRVVVEDCTLQSLGEYYLSQRPGVVLNLRGDVLNFMIFHAGPLEKQRVLVLDGTAGFLSQHLRLRATSGQVFRVLKEHFDRDTVGSLVKLDDRPPIEKYEPGLAVFDSLFVACPLLNASELDLVIELAESVRPGGNLIFYVESFKTAMEVRERLTSVACLLSMDELIRREIIVKPEITHPEMGITNQLVNGSVLTGVRKMMICT